MHMAVLLNDGQGFHWNIPADTVCLQQELWPNLIIAVCPFIPSHWSKQQDADLADAFLRPPQAHTRHQARRPAVVVIVAY